jgi:phage minor structural protein
MLLIFDKNERLQAVLSNDGMACPYFNAVHDEKINLENTFTFSIPADHADAQYVVEGSLVAFEDLDSEWQLFEVKRTIDTDDTSSTKQVYCDAAFYELLGDIVTTGGGTVTAWIALISALSQSRWEEGNVADLGIHSTTFDHQTALGCLQQIAATWQGELQFRVTIANNIITHRYVDLVTRRGSAAGKVFVFGKDLKKVTREVDFNNVYTAMYGRGKGTTESSRLTFADSVWIIPTNPVNKPIGQEWVSDTAALAQYGVAAGTRHRFGLFDDSQEADPLVLLQKTWDALQIAKEPVVNYQFDAMLLEQLSPDYSHEAVRIGDTTAVLDNNFSPPLQLMVRVVEIQRDILEFDKTKITLGNFKQDLTTTQLAQNDINRQVKNNAGIWDNAAALVPSVLDPAIYDLTSELRSAGGYVVFSANEGIMVYDTPDPATATKVMRLGAGIFGIADSKILATGEWNWRTFGSGTGFTADLITAGKLLADRIQIGLGTTYEEGYDPADVLANFVGTTYASDLANLQSQLDGSITTWFYAYVPTQTNAPANLWIVAADKNNHLGDLFYDLTTGYAYRFAIIATVYQWTLITDSDVTKALADAAKAQDTADHKRRVFVATPVPPYDVGDLWAQGSSGDLLRCMTPRVTGQLYSFPDWIISSKYTDDTAAALAQAQADSGVANAADAQNTANTAVTNAATAQTQANTGVTNAATAQTKANLGVTNAATAQTRADLGVTNAGLAQTQATLGVTNAGLAQTQANAGVANALTAQNRADVGVANALIAQTQADLGVTNALAAQGTANTANTAAGAAQTTANTATANAGSANTLLADLADDNKLTPSEKSPTLSEWNIIVSEKLLNHAQALVFAVSETAYQAAYDTLNTYVPPLIASLTTTTTIVGTTFRANFKAYYDARTNILNAIAAKAKTLADTAQGQATTATTNAATAQTQANVGVSNALAAQGTANTATTNAATAQTRADLGVSNAATAQTQATLGVTNALTAQTQATLGVNNAAIAQTQATLGVTNAATAQTKADLGVTNAGLAQARADIGVANAATAQTQANTATTNAATAQTQANLGVANAATAQTQANTGVTNAATAQTQATLGVTNALAAQTQANLGVANALTAQATANTANTAAGTASTAAGAAQTTANTAKTYTDNLASDTVITPDEKLSLKQTWDLIVVEGTATTGTIPVQTTLFGVADTAFDTAYSTLNTYLNTTLTVFTSMTTATTGLVRSTWDTNWKNYYSARTNLLNAIAAQARTLANTAQTQANLGVTNAGTAQTQANLGVANALTAQTQATLGVANAATAQAKANQGVTDAATAQTQANAGVANAATAQTKADLGVTNAATAQGQANTATTNAATAQTQANLGVTNAAAAQALLTNFSTATTVINRNSNFYWDSTGLVAKDPNNAQNLVRMTSGGLGISTNGGTSYVTAITAAGVVASAIMAGTITGVTLSAGTITGGTITGANITADGGAYFITDPGSQHLATTVYSLPNLLADASFEGVLNYDQNNGTTLGTSDILGFPPDPTYYDYNPKFNGNWYGWSSYVWGGNLETTQMAPHWSTTRHTYSKSESSNGKSMAVVNSTNFYSQGVDLATGQNYFVSVSHCQKIGTGWRSIAASKMRLEVCWSSGLTEVATPAVQTYDFVSTTSWQRSGVMLTVPAGVDGARIRLKSPDANWIYIDGVQLVQGNVAGKFDPLDDLWSHINGEIGFCEANHAPFQPIAGSYGSFWPCVPVIKGDGVLEAGKYIDFHDVSNDNAKDYSVRLMSASGILYLNNFQISSRTWNGTATHATNTTGSQTITMGFSPRRVRIKASLYNHVNLYYDSDGCWERDGPTVCCWFRYGSSGSNDVALGTSRIVMMHSGVAVTECVVVATATGITLSWDMQGTTIPTDNIMMAIRADG